MGPSPGLQAALTTCLKSQASKAQRHERCTTLRHRARAKQYRLAGFPSCAKLRGPHTRPGVPARVLGTNRPPACTTAAQKIAADGIPTEAGDKAYAIVMPELPSTYVFEPTCGRFTRKRSSSATPLQAQDPVPQHAHCKKVVFSTSRAYVACCYTIHLLNTAAHRRNRRHCIQTESQTIQPLSPTAPSRTG